MKVKCINDKWQAAPGCEEAPRPIFNQNYSVIDTVILEGVESFLLAEMPIEYGYGTKNFAPLTSLDETKLVSEEFKEKYLVPVK